MNGWEKVAGLPIVLSGLVYLIAVALGVADGLDVNNSCLEAFVDLDKFACLSAVAGMIAAIAGLLNVCYGIAKKQSIRSILGILMIFLGIVVYIVPFKDDISTLDWNNIEAIIIGLCAGIVLVSALLCVSKRNYFAADIALIFAYIVVIVYVINLEMVNFVVAMVGIMVAGILTLIPAKEVKVEVVEEHKVAVYEREIVPATGAVPANPPVVKEKPVEEPAPVKPAKAVKEEAKPAPAKEEAAKAACVAEESKPVAEPAKEDAPAATAVESAPAKEEAANAAPVKEAESVSESSKVEESEEDKALRQGYETAVAAVGDDKAAEMSDEEIMAVVKDKDPALYATLSAMTGIVVADAVAEESEEDKALRQGYETAVAAVGDDKAAEMSDEEIMAVVKDKDPALYATLSAMTGIVVADAVAEESEMDKLLRQGYEITVANVGEDRAMEMDDYEIMAVISVVDPELYAKLSILTGIVVASEVADEAPVVEEATEGKTYSDEELGLIPDTPNGFVRRACWNKGLRCRKDYGPHYIPIAFVKSKVAVYIDGATPDTRNDVALSEQGWIVLHFKESDITDGAEQAEVVNAAVKENTRAMKKAKAKSKKKR